MVSSKLELQPHTCMQYVCAVQIHNCPTYVNAELISVLVCTAHSPALLYMYMYVYMRVSPSPPLGAPPESCPRRHTRPLVCSQTTPALHAEQRRARASYTYEPCSHTRARTCT